MAHRASPAIAVKCCEGLVEGSILSYHCYLAVDFRLGAGAVEGPEEVGSGRPRPAGLVIYTEATFLGAENSEVSPLEASRFTDVAVAVTVWPLETAVAGEKVKEALPLPSVLTNFWPMNFLPSSPEGFEIELGGVAHVGATGELARDGRLAGGGLRGRDDRLVLQAVGSGVYVAGVVGGVAGRVLEAALRSMPSSALEKMELREILLPSAGLDLDPVFAVEGYGVRARGGAVPDGVVRALQTSTPASPLPRAPVPLAVVPMRLPSTLLSCESPKMPRRRSSLPETRLRAPAVAPPTVLPESVVMKTPAVKPRRCRGPWCRSCRCLCSCPGCGCRSRR